MASRTVPPRSASALAGILGSPEIGRLIAELEDTRWTGRPGYPIRAMVGVALAKSLYSIPTWTRTVALVREHDALREAIGGECRPSTPPTASRQSSAPTPTCSIRASRAFSNGSTPKSPSSAATSPSTPPTCPPRERSALPLEERSRAPALLRPRRLLGPPLGSLDPQGWRLLRLPGPRGGLRPHGPPRRVAGRVGARPRIVLCHRAARRGEESRLRRRDDRARHGLRHGSDPRGLRGPRFAPDHRSSRLSV